MIYVCENCVHHYMNYMCINSLNIGTTVAYAKAITFSYPLAKQVAPCCPLILVTMVFSIPSGNLLICYIAIENEHL